MISECIDLYEKFGVARCGAKGGFLRTYVSRVGRIKRKLRPSMLIIPGGAYRIVSETEDEPVAVRFMSDGYACFVLEYSTKTRYPAPLIEACMAMLYIRDNAEYYGVDREHVCAIGFSAGGHLAAMLGNIWNENEIVSALGKRAEHARPDAVILSYPVITTGEYAHSETCDNITGGDESLIERLSVEKRVTKDSAPAFLWCTYGDADVPIENSLLYAAAYRRVGVPFALHVFERGWHGMSLCSSEVNDQSEAESKLVSLGKWYELALDWLNGRGFVVRPVE